jgi:hypothetical protein
MWSSGKVVPACPTAAREGDDAESYADSTGNGSPAMAQRSRALEGFAFKKRAYRRANCSMQQQRTTPSLGSLVEVKASPKRSAPTRFLAEFVGSRILRRSSPTA